MSNIIAGVWCKDLLNEETRQTQNFWVVTFLMTTLCSSISFLLVHVGRWGDEWIYRSVSPCLNMSTCLRDLEKLCCV